MTDADAGVGAEVETDADAGVDADSEADAGAGLRATIADVIRQTVVARLDALEATTDQNRADIDDLRDAYHRQQDRLDALHDRVDSLAGLHENEETTAKKRRRDLLVALQRTAESRNGYAEMDYSAVLEQWRVLGHGTGDTDLYAKQAHRAMEQLSRLDGIEHDTSQRPQVVKLDLDAFDSSTPTEAVDDVNNLGNSPDTRTALSHGD